MAIAELPTPAAAAAAGSTTHLDVAGLAQAGLGAALAQVLERVRPSVVEVRSRGAGAGAGTIWHPDGTIVTNHHVVPSDRAGVALADGRTFDARVVARDPHNDLAVLSVEARDLPAATPGDARALRPGELVLAVGHPFGVRGALSFGVVSRALSRSMADGSASRGRRELVCADVRLGPGNSGGPLADARGRVVGINAMIDGGLALAVPTHLAQRLVSGGGGRPVLGVEARDVELPAALTARAWPAAGRQPLSGRVRRAPIVLGVDADGAAARAGVLLGDVLVAFDGALLDGTDGLLAALERHDGGLIRLTILRGGAPLEIVVAVDRERRPAA